MIQYLFTAVVKSFSVGLNYLVDRLPQTTSNNYFIPEEIQVFVYSIIFIKLSTDKITVQSWQNSVLIKFVQLNSSFNNTGSSNRKNKAHLVYNRFVSMHMPNTEDLGEQFRTNIAIH